jgi:hypothetical protein
MKDKTHAMNGEMSSADAEQGFGNAGKPSTRRQYKDNQQACADLEGNEALEKAENPDGSPGYQVGGFLPRNNSSDRY